MENKKVIECVNLEKKYFLFDKDYKIIPWLFTKKGCSKEIIPLTDINLTVNKGDVIGFVGKNGAGKSTLMKIIAGITMHTGGSLSVQGKVNSLINLGAGFNPKYTGRQNIYYKGLLMGMSKEDVDLIIEDIIEFCELGDYFDLPQYMYSSGMSARLGFALAIFAEHDILIVDEVFAVGDKNFQAKSSKKMRELFKSGKSIIFASHSEEQIREFCNRAIFIDESKIVVDGTVDEALAEYNKKYAPK
ncbi:MAG: ABC transporter ATP-binding protein, partial [Lachnospirales bacterium]